MQTTKQIPFVNEAVMSNIKKRLKDAYDSVTFYANKTWTNDYYLYQRANQELYARHIKIQEAFAEEVTRARTVRDSIPQSKLAHYSNYEYDESRELSYTPNGTDVTFHYPCQQKDDLVEEPWMLPEVEQLFIWLTYSRDFNLLQYRDLVDFDHSESPNRTKQTCTLEDFHKVDPRFYETFERTPGKSRFTSPDCMSDVELKLLVPPLLNVNTFEDMTVKMKLNLDTIKNIWKTSRSDDVIPPKKVQVFKSSFENLFVNENSKSAKYLQYPEYFSLDNVPYHFNELQEKATDFRNLQNLAELLKKLKEVDMNQSTNITRLFVPNSKSETDTATNKTTPARRLYSDVVQGLVSNKSSSSKIEFSSSDFGSPPLGQSISCKDLQFTMPKVTCIDDTCVGESTCQSYKLNSVVRNRPPTPPASWLEQSWGKSDVKVFQKQDEKKTTEYNFSQSKFATSQSTHPKTFLNSAACTDALSNNTMNTFNNTFINNNHQNCFGGNLVTNEYQPNEIYGPYTNNTYHNPNNFQNIYAGNYYPNNPFQYGQSNMYCSNFPGTNFPTNAYTCPTSSYANQLSSNTRNFVQQKQSAIHFNNSGQQWIMHQYRSPSIYNIAHFPPQPYFLLPPQPPKQQRWMQSPHYIRPPTPQTFHVNMTPPHTPPQNWGVQNQNLYKTNSTQHVCSQNQPQIFETSTSMHNLESRQKYKNRKINSQVNLTYSKTRSRSPESTYSVERDFSAFNKSKSNSKKSSISSDTTCPFNCGKVLLKSADSTDSMDYKFIIKKDSAVTAEQKDLSRPDSSTTVSKDFDCDVKSLPVTASTSEELERQALDEYQSSNESFYKELERQAEEQYDDSENLFSPPNEALYFGGLASVCDFSNFCLPGLPLQCFEVYQYI